MRKMLDMGSNGHGKGSNLDERAGGGECGYKYLNLSGHGKKQEVRRIDGCPSRRVGFEVLLIDFNCRLMGCVLLKWCEV